MREYNYSLTFNINIKYKDNKFLELIIFSILNIITENIEIIAPKDNIKFIIHLFLQEIIERDHQLKED